MVRRPDRGYEGYEKTSTPCSLFVSSLPNNIKLRNQLWVARGRMKHIAKEVVVLYYKLYDDSDDNDELTRRRNKQEKIRSLIGTQQQPSANYLYGRGGVSSPKL